MYWLMIMSLLVLPCYSRALLSYRNVNFQLASHVQKLTEGSLQNLLSHQEDQTEIQLHCPVETHPSERRLFLPQLLCPLWWQCLSHECCVILHHWHISPVLDDLQYSCCTIQLRLCDCLSWHIGFLYVLHAFGHWPHQKCCYHHLTIHRHLTSDHVVIFFSTFVAAVAFCYCYWLSDAVRLSAKLANSNSISKQWQIHTQQTILHERNNTRINLNNKEQKEMCNINIISTNQFGIFVTCFRKINFLSNVHCAIALSGLNFLF